MFATFVVFCRDKWKPLTAVSIFIIGRKVFIYFFIFVPIFYAIRDSVFGPVAIIIYCFFFFNIIIVSLN